MGANDRLDRKVIDEIVDRVSRELQDLLGAVPLPPPQRETPASLSEAIGAVRGATSQPEILRALLHGAALFGARAALFVSRGDHLEGWEGVGFEDDPAIGGVLRGIRIERDQPAVATLFEENRPVHAEIGGPFAVPDFGQTIRGEALLVPLRVQDKVAGVLYADPSTGSRPVDRPAIEALAQACGLAVERGVLSRALAQLGATVTGANAVGGHPSGPLPRSTAPAPARAAAPVAPPPVAAAPPEPSAAAFAAPVPPAPAPSPVAEVPAAPVPAPAAGGFEFPRPGSPTPPGSTPEIEDARRYARLLMEEILLYHGDRVRDGVAHRDLVARLSDELAKARQLYDVRVDARVREGGDYFEEALVRVLAQGDARALGTYV
jgi:hypothetical protein